MILKLKNQNMAAFKAVAFQSLACVWFCVSTAAAVQNCSLVNCKVLPVGENIASEFRLKASEKGVRMIYLNLKIGNNSYNPLELQDEFKPDRWVWARSNKEQTKNPCFLCRTTTTFYHWACSITKCEA